MDFSTKALSQSCVWREAPNTEFALIGEELSHSLSPVIHNAAFKALNLPYTYAAINVPRGEVSLALDHLKERGYIGVNVTMPHKEEALQWLTHFDPGEYPEVKAVNTILLGERKGFNTDTVGFRQTLENSHTPTPPRPQTCLVIGAGGAARAVVAVLARLGCEIKIWNRTHARAVELANLYENVEAVPEPDTTGCDLVVNCTSASKYGAPSPAAMIRAPEERGAGGRGSVRPVRLAYDLFYSRHLTPFLQQAKEHGWQTMDGIPMLIHQAAAAWKYWGIKETPDTKLMEDAARAALKANA